MYFALPALETMSAQNTDEDATLTSPSLTLHPRFSRWELWGRACSKSSAAELFEVLHSPRTDAGTKDRPNQLMIENNR